MLSNSARINKQGLHILANKMYYFIPSLQYYWQEHIDRAIELRPEEPILHYLNGRWCFEVAGLSWLEKKAAAALFATPPEATYEQALGYFMKCEELNPGTWKANMLMVAKVRDGRSRIILLKVVQ